MSFYVWLFPLIFIFHDMEEIIGFISWIKKNKSLLQDKYSKFIRPYEGVTTEDFAAAVFEELILCIVISGVSYETDWYGIWIGGFIGCTLHFVMHILETVIIKMYIPALITSVICLPVSCMVMYKSLEILSYSIGQIVWYTIMGSVLIALNLKFAHWIMKNC